MDDFYDPELDLLGDDTLEDESTGSLHAFRTAPIFTGDAFAALGSSILPQRALYGRVIAQKATNFPVRITIPKLYINTNAPFSALVCGVQVRVLTCLFWRSFHVCRIAGFWEKPFHICSARKLPYGRFEIGHASGPSECPCVRFFFSERLRRAERSYCSQVSF